MVFSRGLELHSNLARHCLRGNDEWQKNRQPLAIAQSRAVLSERLVEMEVKAVLFDLDDTLIADAAREEQSLREISNVIGADPDEFVAVARSSANAHFDQLTDHDLCVGLGVSARELLWSDLADCHPILDGLKRALSQFRHSVWTDVVQKFGLLAHPQSHLLSEGFREKQRSSHEAFAGVPEMLEKMSQTYRLGLVTNGPADIQRIKLQTTGLKDFFDAVAISGETGMGKPRVEQFEGVLARLGVQAENTVMVGDNWDRDVKGALACGIRPVWVSAGRTAPSGDANVLVVRRVIEVREVLDGLASSAA